jgi:LacI family transcriptional regulator
MPAGSTPLFPLNFSRYGLTTQRRIAVAVNVVDPYPHHQDVFAGVLQYAHEHADWQCFIDEHPAYRARQRMQARGPYHGVIARADPDMQKRLKAQGVPLVSTWYEHHRPGLAGVYMDPVTMGRLAADHLIGRGYRRFAIYKDPQGRHIQAIAAAFVTQLEEAELPYTAMPVPDGETTSPEDWIRLEKTMANMLEKLEPPVAVFIDSAVLARILVELSQHRGLHVPQDVAVLCLNNPRRLLEIPTSISSIQDSYHQIGYEAAALLDRLMRGEPVPHDPVLIQSPGIAARASTDHFAVDDQVVAEALRYISAHLKGKIHVEEIAAALNVSLSALYNRFETAMGRTIGSEIRRLRINSARIMLAEKNLSIKQVAKRAGFASTDVMTRVFKSTFGMTPKKYQHQVEQKRVKPSPQQRPGGD